MKPIRILLADDHEVVRSGLCTMISKMAGYMVCGEATNGREALRLAEELSPDIVVLDISMPELNGLDTAREIRRLLPDTQVMFITGDRNPDLVTRAFEIGARAFLSKAEKGDEFRAALESLRNRKPYFSKEVSEILFQRFMTGRAKAGEHQPTGDLSQREREIAQLVVEGRTNKEVAATLHISEKTVEGHRAAIMRKLKLKTFSDLVRWAIRNHLIAP